MAECHKFHRRDITKSNEELEDRAQGENKTFKLLMKGIKAKIPYKLLMSTFLHLLFRI